MKPIALIVAPTLSQRVVRCLARTGFDLHVVASFEAAKAELIEQPDLLITEIRLAAYNGLHLALRAQARGIRSIVIGAPDLLFERDAARFGAQYLNVAALDELTAIAERLAQNAVILPSHFDNGVHPTAFDILPDIRRASFAL
jgi:hypothetical protein